MSDKNIANDAAIPVGQSQTVYETLPYSSTVTLELAIDVVSVIVFSLLNRQ